MSSDALSAGAAVASALIASVALLLAWKANNRAASLETVHAKEDQALSRRQMFLTLWPHLRDIRRLKPGAGASFEQMRQVLNVLELVAICWESKAVDQDLIRRGLMPLYLDLRDDLYGATAETGQTGREMLAQAPAVESVYAEMKRVRDAAGVIV